MFRLRNTPGPLHILPRDPKLPIYRFCGYQICLDLIFEHRVWNWRKCRRLYTRTKEKLLTFWLRFFCGLWIFFCVGQWWSTERLQNYRSLFLNYNSLYLFVLLLRTTIYVYTVFTHKEIIMNLKLMRRHRGLLLWTRLDPLSESIKYPWSTYNLVLY